jgi:hypothetical protein
MRPRRENVRPALPCGRKLEIGHYKVRRIQNSAHILQNPGRTMRSDRIGDLPAQGNITDGAEAYRHTGPSGA